ncbi:MAG: hypothetical protein IPL69_05510 [Saprospiraceae bacterium]|nr:hypothetical protein [Candidatus Brachybacter algidus]
MSYKYILEPTSKKHVCPSCNKKRFVRYININAKEYLPEMYGRCDREANCSYHINPYTTGFEGEKTNVFSKLRTPDIDIQITFEGPSKLDCKQVMFTEIETFPDGRTGLPINYYSIFGLTDRLNKFRKAENNKHTNPAILKGVYREGTSGEFYINPIPLLFFDLDVKENENQTLLNKAVNDSVFQILMEISLLSWKSNSGKGIAGLLYVPQLGTITHNEKERHLKYAYAIYRKIEQYVYKYTSILIKLDNQQGKFRQIRYLAEQDTVRHINKEFRTISIEQIKSKRSYIPYEVLNDTLKSEYYNQNHFIQNLLSNVKFPLETKDIEKVISQYYLGTFLDQYMVGAATFPFIDGSNKIRAVQVKKFDKSNHTIATDYLHSLLKKGYNKSNEAYPSWLLKYDKNEKVISCLFGEHLLSKYPNNPVAIVEAPKTAIYGTLYYGFPESPEDLIWLAVYNKSSIKYDKLKVLKGREVLIFPDLSRDGSTFIEWQQKIKKMKIKMSGTRFIFSKLLEKWAPAEDRLEGFDIADYLIQMDWRSFRSHGKRKKALTTISMSCEECEKSEESNNTFFINQSSSTIETIKVEKIGIEENGNIPPQPLEKQYFNMEDLIALEARASQTITDSHLKNGCFLKSKKQNKQCQD